MQTGHLRAQVEAKCLSYLIGNGCLLDKSAIAVCGLCSGLFERVELLTRLRLGLGIDAGGTKLRGWILMSKCYFTTRRLLLNTMRLMQKDEALLDFSLWFVFTTD